MAFKAILGQKMGMTRVFSDEGKAMAVTVVEALPNTVTQIKTQEKHGYNAIQIAYGQKKHPPKPQIGHLKKTNLKTARWLREFKISPDAKIKVGDIIKVDVFKEGDKVKVTGTSKGKGFAGTIKRWGFARGPETHGSGHVRRPGSIGSMFPQRVWKGKKMPGHMGAERVTVKSLKIVKVDSVNSLILLAGAVPGPKKGFLAIEAVER